jgi:hypothetical protein
MHPCHTSEGFPKIYYFAIMPLAEFKQAFHSIVNVRFGRGTGSSFFVVKDPQTFTNWPRLIGYVQRREVWSFSFPAERSGSAAAIRRPLEPVVC